MQTLSDYLNKKSVSEPLKSVLNGLAGAGVSIARALRLEIKGETGTQNPTGDTQKQVDILANNVLMDVIRENPHVCAIISEEEEESEGSGGGGEDGGGKDRGDEGSEDGDGKDRGDDRGGEGEKYSVAFDPIDGSSIADVNQAVGSIIAIYKGANIVGASGRDIAAALYIVYGPRMTLMISVGKGTDEFLYNYDEKTYFLNTAKIKLKEECKMFAPGNLRACETEGWYARMLMYWAANRYTLRYSGGMVSDVNHILRKGGGIFSYPADQKLPDGKLRLAYECNPMAFLVEQAGGCAIAARNRKILDLKIKEAHQRTPFFAGSPMEVSKLTDFMNA